MHEAVAGGSTKQKKQDSTVSNKTNIESACKTHNLSTIKAHVKKVLEHLVKGAAEHVAAQIIAIIQKLQQSPNVRDLHVAKSFQEVAKASCEMTRLAAALECIAAVDDVARAGVVGVWYRVLGFN